MSDVLVKGMKMPKNCCYCGFVRLISTKACCFAVHDNHKDDDVIEYDVTEADLADTTDKMQKKPSWCPLIPVPKHGRMIDVDKLITSFRKWANAPIKRTNNEIADFLEEYSKDFTLLEAST